jgi:hypothetical protein
VPRKPIKSEILKHSNKILGAFTIFVTIRKVPTNKKEKPGIWEIPERNKNKLIPVSVLDSCALDRALYFGFDKDQP